LLAGGAASGGAEDCTDPNANGATVNNKTARINLIILKLPRWIFQGIESQFATEIAEIISARYP
jgi:hypothetical protein